MGANLLTRLPYLILAALVAGAAIAYLPDEIVFYHGYFPVVIVLFYHEQFFGAYVDAFAATVTHVLIDDDAIIAAGVCITVVH